MFSKISKLKESDSEKFSFQYLSVLNVFNWVFTVSYRHKRTSYRNLNSLRIWTKLNIHFQSQNYLSESNSCRKSFSLIGNITPIGLFENPIELSIFSIGNYFSYGKYYFPMGYWFSKVNILPIRWNILPIRWKTLTTNKVIYSLYNDIDGFLQNCILSGWKNANLGLT